MQTLTPRHAAGIDALIAQGFSSTSLAGLRGLGGTQAANIILSTGSTAASAAAGATAGAIFGAANAAWAVPVVGAAIAGITLAIGAWINRKGPQQRTMTTKIVNEAEPILVDNLNAYMSGPHTVSSQQVALANFDNVWEQVLQACGNPAYGDPGKHCISDRERGTTHVNDKGQSFDWFKLYRDPIANDTAVVPDPTAAQIANKDIQNTLGLNFTTASGVSMVPLFLIGGLLLLAVRL
jgi:hypothetical protein